ncbi:hypothetical protein [Cellvibrio mixtus]|uniref:hypothetical protein n=1 Tax=Cellvibrio mixtus TaxID=39650 RepID=UPI001269E325|nr:hypothetical protein [Cellvibrio mixtus]
MNDFLEGRAVRIRMNDFIAQDTFAQIAFVDEEHKKILLKLNTPLDVGGVIYSYAVASPRLAQDNLLDLLKGSEIGSSVTWVPLIKFDENRPLDLSWWRGGAAAITDILLN